MVDLFRFRHWDLISRRWIYYVISSLLLLAGLFALFTKGLNLGIDFRGGGLVTYTVHGTLQNPTQVIEQVRTGLVQEGTQKNDEGLKSAEVQIVSAGSTVTGVQEDQILVHTLVLDDVNANAVLKKQVDESITPVVGKVLTGMGFQAPTRPDSQEMVGRTISNELVKQGIVALIIGSFLIMLWIGFRYNIGGLGFRYSLGGIIALLHDLLILVGMFAILRNFLQVNSPFIAALLTVMGYSIHDTIVIYDRIRENSRLRKGRTFAETVNISLLETMARSVNTILTVLFTLLALFFFGGSTLRDFVAAMLIGVVFGGYSSIFIASQLLVSWSKGQDKIILPVGEKPVLATAAAVPVAQPVAPAAVATSTVETAAPAAKTVSKDAIQRARQAGKTSKRNR